MSDLLERTDESTDLVTTDDGDHDRYAHYFRKSDLDRALLEGVEIQAICGKIDRPMRGIDGRTVCPACKEEYDSYIDEHPKN